MPPKESVPASSSPRTLRPGSDWLLRLPAFLRFFLVRGYVRFRQGLTLLVFFLVDRLAPAFVRRGDSGAVVIVKNDALGDYILFRNFLAAVRRHPAYHGRRLVFCGSSAAREMAETFDRAVVDEFIWIERGLPARFRLVRRLKKIGAHVAFSPVFWRNLMNDSLVRATAAPIRIGWATPPSRKLWSEKTGWINWNPALFQALGNRCYTRLVPAPPRSLFEFERNRLFFQAVLESEPLPARPELTPVPADIPAVPEPFALLLPGAGQVIKEWPAKSYAEIARQLSEKHGFHIVIVGTARDAEKAQRIREISGLECSLFAGQLSLAQLAALMARAAIVVANDSAGIHLAAALRRKGVAVSNSMGLIEFHPYPPELDPTVRFVYPAAVHAAGSFEAFNAWHATQPKKVAVSDVDVTAVLAAIEEVLGSA